MVLEWTRPALPSPLRPICDPRVLDRFIKEARDAEVAMRSCTEGCSLAEPVSVPLTSVDFDIWDSKDAQEQFQEVQSGLWLLSQAIGMVRTSVTNTALLSLLDNSDSNLRSIGQVIRSLNIQDYNPAAGVSAPEEIWWVSNILELFRVHANFLRGKVHLLMSHAPACQQEAS